MVLKVMERSGTEGGKQFGMMLRAKAKTVSGSRK